MAFLDNLKISTRLALAFGYVVALAAAIVLVGVSRLGDVDRSYQAVGKLNRVERDALNGIVQGTEAAARSALVMAQVDADKSKLSQSAQQLEAQLKSATDASRDLGAMDLPPAEKDLARRLGESAARAQTAVRAVAAQLAQGDHDGGVRKLLGEVLPALDGLRELGVQMADVQRQRLDQSVEQVDSDIVATRYWMLAIGLLAVVVAVVAIVVRTHPPQARKRYRLNLLHSQAHCRSNAVRKSPISAAPARRLN